MTPERWEQINKLYYAAMEVEDKGRTSFLEQACKEDRELRSEVESLLKMNAQMGGFLGTPTMEEVAREMKDEPCLCWGAGWVLTRFSRCWAPAVWERFTRHETRG